ncbi:hypothetical protein GTV32_14210 [Gordonia sp. SID5947]|uniref:hypothetical protein n=1 Tax=Gordonia sp. SID5947 TaxID=2690315 RepID=UPI00136C4F37|nr:hypothetical protein [Gordonia sp. SID5947]MYR07388.1 hypothetical protein [Gordonia sp. SID5947]
MCAAVPRDTEFDKFKLEQYRDLYARYLAAANSLASKSAAISVAFTSINDPENPFEYADQLSELLTTRDDYSAVAAEVDLVGSPEVVGVVSKIDYVARSVTTTAANASKPWYATPRNAEEVRSFELQFNLKYSELEPLIQEFVSRARPDILANE